METRTGVASLSVFHVYNPFPPGVFIHILPERAEITVANRPACSLCTSSGTGRALRAVVLRRPCSYTLRNIDDIGNPHAVLGNTALVSFANHGCMRSCRNRCSRSSSATNSSSVGSTSRYLEANICSLSLRMEYLTTVSSF